MAGELSRVTVVGKKKRVDVAVPSSTLIGEYSARLAGCAEQERDPTPPPPGRWRPRVRSRCRSRHPLLNSASATARCCICAT